MVSVNCQRSFFFIDKQTLFTHDLTAVMAGLNMNFDLCVTHSLHRLFLLLNALQKKIPFCQSNKSNKDYLDASEKTLFTIHMCGVFESHQCFTCSRKKLCPCSQFRRATQTLFCKENTDKVNKRAGRLLTCPN